MDITIIGAGNLATHLSTALQGAGHNIRQVYSRTEASASTLAERLHCSYTTTIDGIRTDSQLYIISIKDSALQQLADRFTAISPDALFVHTAGSMPMDVLTSRRRGVLYPMQTFTKARQVDFSIIPCFIEANNEADETLLMQLCNGISRQVIRLSSDDRKWLHVSAVFCCNFLNHCIALGSDVLQQHGIPFSVMMPLISETIAKLHHLTPAEAQTGPAIRHDENVIQRHLALLADNPQLHDFYEQATRSIQSLNG